MTGDPEEFARVAARLQREKAAAKPVIEKLVAGSIHEVWEREIPADWKTVGFVQELASAASEQLERSTANALALAHLAITIMTAIAADEYPASIIKQTEATAWRTLALVHKYRSDYEAAHRALDAAERHLAEAHALAYERALVQLLRADTYSLQGLYDVARPTLATAYDVFMEYRDLNAAAKCLLTRGNMEKRQGLLTEAATSYETALAIIGRSSEDLHTLAALYTNLGQVRMETGDPNRAATLLQDALGIFSALEMAAELIRVKHYLGKVVLASGNHGQARRIFADVRLRYFQLEMPEEAGLAGLDLAEASLATRDVEGAEHLVASVYAEFKRANLNARAVAALEYLREIVGTSQGRSHLRYVREYVLRLRAEPTLAFIPPPLDT